MKWLKRLYCWLLDHDTSKGLNTCARCGKTGLIWDHEYYW